MMNVKDTLALFSNSPALLREGRVGRPLSLLEAKSLFSAIPQPPRLKRGSEDQSDVSLTLAQLDVLCHPKNFILPP